MKLGERIYNPFTKQRGEFVHMRNGKPIGRDSEGRLFVGKSAKGRKPKARCVVRIKEDGVYLSLPVEAELSGDTWLIVGDEPIWRGARVQRDLVEVQT